MLRLSGDTNPGPPALQASTLWKEPFERPYLVAIRDLTCVATAPPQVTMGDRGWIRLRVTYTWRSDRMHVAVWELRITSGSPLCRGLTKAIYNSENVASQRGYEPGTSCTAGEYSMKRAIQTALFSCHSGSHLCCYRGPLWKARFSLSTPSIGPRLFWPQNGPR